MDLPSMHIIKIVIRIRFAVAKVLEKTLFPEATWNVALFLEAIRIEDGMWYIFYRQTETKI